MERESAIDLLDNLIGMIEDNQENDYDEALKMAINALHREQQFLDTGYKNGRVEFMIGGRKFMVKELAQ